MSLLQAAKHLNEALQRVLHYADEYGSKSWQDAENHWLRALSEFNQAIARAVLKLAKELNHV